MKPSIEAKMGKTTETKKHIKLYFSNAPIETQELDIFDLFNPFGKITNIDLIRDKKGNSIGSGFVEFEDPQVVKYAIESLNGTKYHNLKLFLKSYTKKRSKKRPKDKENVFDRLSEYSDYEYTYDSDFDSTSREINEVKSTRRKESLDLPPPPSLPLNHPQIPSDSVGFNSVFPKISPDAPHHLISMQNQPNVSMNTPAYSNNEVVYWTLKRKQVIANLQRDAYEMMFKIKDGFNGSKYQKTGF